MQLEISFQGEVVQSALVEYKHREISKQSKEIHWIILDGLKIKWNITE